MLLVQAPQIAVMLLSAKPVPVEQLRGSKPVDGLNSTFSAVLFFFFFPLCTWLKPAVLRLSWSMEREKQSQGRSIPSTSDTSRFQASGSLSSTDGALRTSLISGVCFLDR